MGATCAKTPQQFPSLGVFFERGPSASFAARRLQLESVIVLARLSGRFLALPPSSAADFHEERFWSLSQSLCAPVFLGWNGKFPPSAFRVDACLAGVSVDDLPKDRHWVFGAEASSLNFRRLRLPQESLVAAESFVSDGFELTQDGIRGHGFVHRDKNAAVNIMSIYEALADEEQKERPLQFRPERGSRYWSRYS